jgi:pre-mRNA-splicing helicase BRR2
MAEKMNKLLQNADLLTRDLENELMEILDYDHFDLVTFCLENRWRLVYKMKLLDGVDETKVYDEMRSLNLHGLVDEFQGVRQSSKRRLSDLETSVKKQKKISTKRQPREVDLSALAFDQGSHMISTNRVKLPPGSYQQKKKLYDIISIPAPTPAEDNDPLISISELPSWAQEVFPSSETKNLNRIQSKIYPSAFKTDENLLLCAPTGAGKTNVAMLTILRTLEHYRKEDGRFDLGEFKIVYVAPLKALVQEQKREFERRLTPTFGITVNELTGDSSLSAQQISETQIIVTTP